MQLRTTLLSRQIQVTCLQQNMHCGLIIPTQFYSYIPKNTCSTMRLSLALANGTIGHQSEFNWIHQNNDAFAADLASIITADYTFVILRNPVCPARKLFLDKICEKAPDAWKLYDNLDRQVKLDDMTFSNFIHFLEQSKIRNSNIHWRPQVDFLVYEDYDDYFALEQFDRTKGIIETRAGLKIIDSRPLVRHGIDRWNPLPVQTDYSEAPVAEIAALRRNGDCPHPRSLFTDLLIDSVRHVYSADFELYAQKIGVKAGPGLSSFVPDYSNEGSRAQ